jgi:hypothetical protein
VSVVQELQKHKSWITYSVADPHYFDADPDVDPAFHFDAGADPDFTFHSDGDPDPTNNTAESQQQKKHPKKWIKEKVGEGKNDLFA